MFKHRQGLHWCTGCWSWYLRGERELLLGYREWEWIIPYLKFGNGKEMEKNIPEIREREGNVKNHSQNLGMGREWKNLFPKFGNGKGLKKIHSHRSGTGREWKKSIPTIREWESEAIIPKNTRERERVRNIMWQYLANMWREKEFWPKHSQPHPPPFLIIPRLLVVVTATINEQKSKQNDLIHYNYSL